MDEMRREQMAIFRSISSADGAPPAQHWRLRPLVSIPEATLERAPLASVRRAAVYRVHPRFSHSCTYGADDFRILALTARTRNEVRVR